MRSRSCGRLSGGGTVDATSAAVDQRGGPCFPRDVHVVDADGNRIPWAEVSRIDDHEMRDLMREIVNRLYTFHLCADEPGLRAEIDRMMTVAGKWDQPEIVTGMIGGGRRPR